MNYFAFGFVGVAAVIGLGVDYQQQSMKADLPLGQMSLGMYVDTYEARFLGAKAEALAAERERKRQENWKKGGIQYLPEAPDGWTRRKYSEGVNTAIMFEEKVFYEELSKSGGAKSLAENFKAQKAAQSAAETDKHSFVYERGDETVFISVNTKNKVNDNAFGSMLGLMMGGFDGVGVRSVLGYKVVGGVGFIELPKLSNRMGGMAVLSDDSGKDKLGFQRSHFRRLSGIVGFNQEVSVTVHANASTESTLEILNTVDWDGLNEMLATPMALVGNDVFLPEEMDEAEIAKAQYALRRKFNGLRSQVAQFKLYNANEAAMVMNMYMRGSVDVTGGAVPDLSALVEAAFRKEMRDLMAGRPSTDEYSRILSMIEERPEEERPQFDGEMSEELKRELYGANDAGMPEDPALQEIQKAQLEQDIRDARSLAARAKAQRAASEGNVVRIGLNDDMRDMLKKKPQEARVKIDIAVALMEKKKGFPRGSCALNETAQEIHCRPAGKGGTVTSDATRMVIGVSPEQVAKWGEDKAAGFKDLTADLRRIEAREGLRQGACAPARDRPQIICDLTQRQTAEAAPGKSGGWMGKLKGVFGGGDASGGSAATARRGEAQVVVRNGQGKAGVGAAAGNCSYEGGIKRCTVGN